MDKNQQNNLLGLVGAVVIVLSLTWLLLFMIMGVDGAIAWMVDLLEGML